MSGSESSISKAVLWAGKCGRRREPSIRNSSISDSMFEIEDKALVLFSGGQDSTTCLAWALARYAHVETVGFFYGQRHAVEMSCRQSILAALGPLHANLGADHVLDIA